jgi:hypothetical protein
MSIGKLKQFVCTFLRNFKLELSTLVQFSLMRWDTWWLDTSGGCTLQELTILNASISKLISKKHIIAISKNVMAILKIILKTTKLPRHLRSRCWEPSLNIITIS